MQLISEAKQGRSGLGKMGFDYKTFPSVVTVTACGGVHGFARCSWTREGYSSVIVSDYCECNSPLESLCAILEFSGVSWQGGLPVRWESWGANMKRSKGEICVLAWLLLL